MPNESLCAIIPPLICRYLFHLRLVCEQPAAGEHLLQRKCSSDNQEWDTNERVSQLVSGKKGDLLQVRRANGMYFLWPPASTRKISICSVLIWYLLFFFLSAQELWYWTCHMSLCRWTSKVWKRVCRGFFKVTLIHKGEDSGWRAELEAHKACCQTWWMQEGVDGLMIQGSICCTDCSVLWDTFVSLRCKN